MVSVHVTVAIKGLRPGSDAYEAEFLVDTGAIDSLAPSSALRRIGIEPVGMMRCELADGTVERYPFGLAQIDFLGETTAGRVIFGPDDAEPLLGVIALESVGMTIDLADRTFKKLLAIPSK